MTLDEAIKHAEEIAEEQECRGYCDRSVCVIMDENNHNCDECEVVKCRECAKEHYQLAEWLKDYKRLLGAIDDIRAEINDKYMSDNGKMDMVPRHIMSIIDKHTSGKENS